MSQFDDVMGRVNQLLSPSSGNSAQMTPQSFIQTQTGPLAQFLAGAQTQPPPGQVAPTGDKQHIKGQQPNPLTNNPAYNAGLGVGVVGALASPEDDVMEAFTHNLGAAIGDVTREFQPAEIQSAIKQLRNQPLTGDMYKDNAIQLASYLHARNTGAVVNNPMGGK